MKLADNGGIVAVVKEDGTIDGMTVNGSIHLNGGAVTLTGALENLQSGVYTILAADSISDGGGAWTLPTLHRFSFGLAFKGSEIKLTVARTGIRIILR